MLPPSHPYSLYAAATASADPLHAEIYAREAAQAAQRAAAAADPLYAREAQRAAELQKGLDMQRYYKSELQRRSSKILPGQCPIYNRFFS